MKISYDELRRINRLEKNTSNLVEVDEDFFSSLKEFVKDEKKDYLDSLQKDFSESKARDFSNLKKTVEEIFRLREKKVLNKALIAVRTDEYTESHMASEEKEVFKKLINLLNSHNSLLTEIFSENSSKRDKKDLDLNRFSIRITREVPKFVGTDMKEYGPFSEGQVIELPEKIAKLFISRKLGEKN